MDLNTLAEANELQRKILDYSRLKTELECSINNTKAGPTINISGGIISMDIDLEKALLQYVAGQLQDLICKFNAL